MSSEAFEVTVRPDGATHGEGFDTFARLAAMDWDFRDANTRMGGHDVHPYPAKFPPQLPRQVLRALTNPGEVVLDPFGGSGTTALEAIAEGRTAISLDANPVAVLLSRAKTRGLTASEGVTLEHVATRVTGLAGDLAGCIAGTCEALSQTPTIANVAKWFDPVSIHELCHLRSIIEELDGACRDAAELALGQTAARVSFQDSETRYVSVPRVVHSGEALAVFSRELLRIAKRLPRIENEDRELSATYFGDARSRADYPMSDESLDLVVTSPPYPNAYDYHLYHRFRMLWTKADPVALRRIEIGSHLRQQTVPDPIADYESDMSAVLRNLHAVLRPGAWCVLVVGDGKYKGQVYSTSQAMERLGSSAGFDTIGTLDRCLPTAKRSVTSAGRRLEAEQIVFLRKPSRVEVHDPEWPMFDYEKTLAHRELDHLGSQGKSGYARLTFAKAVTLRDETVLTRQRAIEKSDGSRRKNSTYASHGIHRYKGKFYPQLGRCLINLSTDAPALIADPFTGSGTVGLEAALLGHRFHGIELSPVGAATARAKLAVMTTRAEILIESGDYLGRALKTGGPSSVDWEQFSADTHEELESWFAPAVLARIARTLGVARRMEQELAGSAPAVELAHICLSDLVREVSHQDPMDLRIRRRRDPLVDAPVERLFLTRWSNATRKVLAAQSVLQERPGTGQIIMGDSTESESWPTDTAGRDLKIDAVITSPPYAAALPYIDTDRLSIAAVFGGAKASRRDLEARLVGSREIGTRDLRRWDSDLRSNGLQDQLPSSTVAFLGALAEAVDSDESAGFRRRQTPAVLARYFTAMSRVMEQVARRLKSGGDAWFVMGDSRTSVGGRDWVIPTTEELAAIGKHQGLELAERIPITVTRENMKHARNAITTNTLLHFVNS